MRLFREGALGMLLRYALASAHLWRWDTRTMRFVRNMRLRGRWKVRAMHRVARMLGWCLGRDSGILLLEEALQSLVRRRGEVALYRRDLEEWRPDVVFCTHQRPSVVLPVVMAAKELGIPTATFIFSWDNLTSKGRIAAPFDHFLVWSQLMKAELLKYYQDVGEDRVHVVGTPQFDAYGDEGLVVSREEFFARIGADPSRPLICYSGGTRRRARMSPGSLRRCWSADGGACLRGDRSFYSDRHRRTLGSGSNG